MPIILAFGALLLLATQATMLERLDLQRVSKAEARTLATELLIVAHRQEPFDVDAASCGTGPQAVCGTELAPSGEVAAVVPGQTRLLAGVRVYRQEDGRATTELMRRRFRTEGRMLDSRTISREMWAVSGGDPRLGVFDGVQMVTPLGARAVGGAVALFETGSVVAQSR
ncbi:hypothetical protein [Thalassobaculum sp.]|uniref:hypothetical protein n=1 Tax=Thalassobaculum sp. TaxID=2022740 RepID=UPI0032EBED3B